MGAISQTNVNFVGSHCGISIGEDGPSQMGLEDIALFRSVPGDIIIYTLLRLRLNHSPDQNSSRQRIPTIKRLHGSTDNRVPMIIN